MKLLRVGDRRVVLARTEQGYVAFDDRCTHKGGPLSDGTLACGRVQCPWHGSQFDVHDGTVQHGPAERPIGTYEVETSGGRVLVSGLGIGTRDSGLGTEASETSDLIPSPEPRAPTLKRSSARTRT